MAAPPPLSTRELVEHAAGAALREVSSVPPLAVLAVLAGLVELLLARLVFQGMPDLLDVTVLFELRRFARFPRNLAAVAGIVAVIASLLAYLRLPGYASIFGRLAVAVFAGIFVPSVAVAAVVEAPALRPHTIVFGIAAAHVLVAVITLSAVRYRAERALRAGLALASMTAVLTLLFLPLGQLRVTQAGFGALLVAGLRHGAELCWIGVSILGAVVAVWDRGAGRVRVRVGVAVALIVASTTALVMLEEIIGRRFRNLLRGSFQVDVLVDELPVAYALPLAIGLAGGLLALVRARTRQLGAGMLAWLAAGVAPHTLIQLLYLVLGALLLARAAQARDPEGAWRGSQPWARLVGRRPEPGAAD